MNFSIERIEKEMEYLDYVRRQVEEWANPDIITVFDRYAEYRNISTAQRLAIEQLAGFVRPKTQCIAMNVNNFYGCQVHIGSIGNAV